MTLPRPTRPPPRAAPDPRDRALGCLLGLALGDAIGAPAEGLPRGGFPRIGGPAPGAVLRGTDDTGLALCLAESLIEDPALDELDLMRRFRRWHAARGLERAPPRDEAGLTTREALERFALTGNPIAGDPAPESAGNGALARLAPIAVAHWRDPARARALAARQARTTHAAPEAVAGAELLALVLAGAIGGAGRAALTPRPDADWPPRIRALADGGWRARAPEDMPSTGYVVHTLAAALCCAWNAEEPSAAVLRAANLGGDADTVAAVAGMVAGALHGAGAWPARWVAALPEAGRIRALAGALAAAGA
jgi:ADP-ribosyl-[dinitrogen reductase] hydrolase